MKSKKDLTKRMNDFGFFASDLLQEMEPDKILFENDGVFVRFSHWEEVSEFLKTKEDYTKQEKMFWEYVGYGNYYCETCWDERGGDISCANRDFCDRIEKRLKESNDER